MLPRRHPLLKIATRSITVELVLHWVVVMVLLLVIMFATQLGRYLGRAADGEISVDVVLIVFALRSVNYVVLLFAPALFFAVLMAIGRLYRDNEMAAWLACGLGPWHLIRSVLGFATILAIIAGIVSLYLDPIAQQNRLKIEAKAAAEAQFSFLEAGKFQVIDDRAVVYVGEISEDGRIIRDVFMHANLDPKQAFIDNQPEPAFTLSATSGIYRENPTSQERELVLQDGRRLEGIIGGGAWQVIDFAEHGLRFQMDDPQTQQKFKRSATTTWELLQTGYANKDIKNLVEFFTRLSVPLTMPLLALLAIPLARSGPRESRYGRLLVGVLAYIAFYNLQSAALNWTEKGTVPAWLGPWWVHALLIGFIIFQFRQQFGTRQVKTDRKRPATGGAGAAV